MIRRLGLPLACLALFAIAGGHWAVLQTVAWAGMVAEYSQRDGLERGVAKTFDGAHPCPLCMKVEEGKKHEEKLPAAAKADKKADATLAARVVVPAFRAATSWPPPRTLAAAPRGDAPPVPPPPILPA